MGDALRLGVAGLGTVGAGLIKLVEKHKSEIAVAAGCPVVVSAVSAQNRDKDRGVDLGGYAWFDDIVELALAPDIDVFVELVGGEEGIALEAVRAALGAGKHVVTANKALLAHHGTALALLAESNNVALSFEAAVAGGIPIIKAMRESFAANEINRVYGILNGTCNYILTKMENEGRSFDDVLREAQEAGYAEADPAFDIGGIDAAHKVALLTSLAFGTEVAFDDLFIEGIENIELSDLEMAQELGYRIKLLGVSQKTESGIEQRVHPAMVPLHSAIAEVGGVTNCVAVTGDFVGDVMLVGPGAGAGPTASSVMADILDIARGAVMSTFIKPASELKKYERAGMRTHEGGYYVRISVEDRPGSFAAIAQRMADEGVSLESIVQRRPKAALPGIGADIDPGDVRQVVMITHPTTEKAIREALTAIEADGHVDKAPQMIRIEKL